jgi:hypothetical protein
LQALDDEPGTRQGLEAVEKLRLEIAEAVENRRPRRRVGNVHQCGTQPGP